MNELQETITVPKQLFSEMVINISDLLTLTEAHDKTERIVNRIKTAGKSIIKEAQQLIWDDENEKSRGQDSDTSEQNQSQEQTGSETDSENPPPAPAA
jgi:divalent metal cation (Fe/Co/Zn/Cd) transporter